MLVRFADAFNDIRNSKLLSEQSIRTTDPSARRAWSGPQQAWPNLFMVAVGMSVRSTNGRASTPSGTAAD